MSRLGKIGRRAFLIGSAAVAGGVAFGAYFVNRQYPNPLQDQLADGEATFNPWVIVSDRKITLVVPHADKGQGIHSAQAALIAEEMDLEFGQFETTFGFPDRAYWNTGIAEELAPYKSTDTSFAAEAYRSAIGAMIKLMGRQGTGGSSSIPDSFVKLREAGAVARETLKLAAAQQNGLHVEDLRTESGAVILPDGTGIPYTSLASVAVELEPARTPRLRDPSEWRLIGKPMQRLDIVPKSTGQAIYGIDFEIEGMVYAAVKRNPCKGGNLKNFDASAVKNMHGVQRVLEIKGGVAVIANNTWRAFQAVHAITCDWSHAPYPDEQDAHWRAVEDSFTEAHLNETWREDGNVEMAEGDEFSAEYRSPYVAHAPLEPLNATIRVTDSAVDVWAGHQTPTSLQQIVASVTGHEPEQVRFHNHFMGGSFGHRLEFDFVRVAAEIAMQMPGVPVKLTYSREEDFAHDFPRHLSIGRGTGKVADGKVLSLDLQIASPSVMASQLGRIDMSLPGPDMQIAIGSWNNPYDLANCRVRAYQTPELAPVSSWRAVGAPGGGFHFDCFLDELIHAAGADPLEERLRLMSHNGSRQVLEAVAKMSNWGETLPAGKGRGVAFVESFGVPTAEVVEVSATEAGIKIDRAWVACDVGRVIDPVNFDNLVKGGVVFGLGHAINCEITYSGGMAEQTNYHAHEAMRMHQCPEIFVRGLEIQDKIRGVGEPPIPPAAPALANAIFAATGQRIREMPFNKHIDFV